MVQEQNFQPQTRDKTNGPHLHTYIPRADGSIMVGGVAYVPQVITPVATATTAAVPAVATSVGGGATVVQPAAVVTPATVIQPATPVLPTPEYYPSPYFPYYSYHLPASLSVLDLSCFVHAVFEGSSWQLLTREQVAPAPPLIYQQPYLPQPQPAYAPYSSPCPYPYPSPYTSYPSFPYTIQTQPPIAGLPAFNIQQPSFGTYGLTGSEVLNQQLQTAHGLEMNKKQEMKPADDDPMRMYWCRELDHTWTQRNRLTIDSGDIGECRWFAMDGQFYVVLLPSS